MELIGYTCLYVPVELLSATGLRPYRLLHGEINLSKQAERLVRVDACPLIKSNLNYVINNKDKFRAMVGSTGCDMSRRMFDVLGEITDIPIFLINNPRADRPHIYYNEIDWLVKQLEHLSRKTFGNDLIGQEIEKWEMARKYFREIDKKRGANPSLIATADFHKAVTNYHQASLTVGSPDLHNPSEDKPRVYLIGSAISYESQPILQLLEKDLRIVGDYNCGLSRFLNIQINDKTINGIKDAYYNQPPCIFKRPNKRFFEFIRSELERLLCTGIVAWTLDYCDNYEYELQKIESAFNLPVLRIKSDFSFQNLSQLRTRISAFAEMLCSKP